MYQLDAFTNRVFRGNPAAVCLLETWPTDELLLGIAAENNLSETAFLVRRQDGDYELRWFTPVAEVDLCGHATLASAAVIFRELKHEGTEIVFHTRSGELIVRTDGEVFTMDFPSRAVRPFDPDGRIAAALGAEPVETLLGDDLLVRLQSAAAIRALRPNQQLLAELPGRGVIVTAAAEDVDFVSRFFAPRLGIPEDPVTGSTHCTLVPYWAAKLGKSALVARQLSPRGGEIRGVFAGDRVKLSGHAVKFFEGMITLPTNASRG